MPESVTGPTGWEAGFTDVERLRVEYWHRGGTLIRITVQLECEIEGRWVAVRRYDTHDMVVHLHTNWPRYRELCETDLRGGGKP